MVKSLFGSRKGVFFFILDVVIGVFIFFLTILLISHFNISKPSLDSSEKAIDRVSKNLFTMPIRNFDNAKTTEMRMNDRIPDMSMTVNQVVVYYWYQDNETMARELVGNTTRWMTGQTGFSYLVNGTEIYNRSAVVTTENESGIKLSRKKVTLLEQGEEEYPPVVVEVSVWQ